MGKWDSANCTKCLLNNLITTFGWIITLGNKEATELSRRAIEKIKEHLKAKVE